MTDSELAPKPRAKRLPPEQRRKQIIEAAVDLIVSNGHSGCTLEQVAQHADISKPLIYKYFPKRDELLRAILQHEFAELNVRGFETISDNVPIERIVRATVERALHYYHDRGPILRLLSTDPVIATMARQDGRKKRDGTSEYFVNKFIEHYGVPEDIATIAVTMVINAPIHSMSYLSKQGIDLDQTIEVWSEFILGGWRALQHRYGDDKPESFPQ